MIIPFITFNILFYNSLLAPGYLSQLKEFSLKAAFLGAFAGHLISPSRNLLVFSPVLLLVIYGLIRKIKTNQINALSLCLIFVILCHWLIASWHLF